MSYGLPHRQDRQSKMNEGMEFEMTMSDGLTQFIQHDLLLDGDGISLGADDDLLTTGLIDSLGIMRLVVFIEETYEKRVPYEDITIDNFRNVRTIVNYLQQLN